MVPFTKANCNYHDFYLTDKLGIFMKKYEEIILSIK